MSTNVSQTFAVHGQSGAWLPDRQLAERVSHHFGTPAFVYNADYLRHNFDMLRQQLSPSIDLLYSLKANPNAAIVDCLRACGAGAEVSSRAELHTAIRVGIDPANIIFVGPAKCRDEIADCIRFGIFAIVAESAQELDEIQRQAEASGVKRAVNVMLRVNPDFKTSGSGLTMSGKPRQFGIDVEQVPGLRGKLDTLALVRVIGFHVYMGTRYLEAEPVIENTENILDMAERLARDLDIEIEAVDVGGGFGVPYFDNEEKLDLPKLARGVNAAVARFRKSNPATRVMIELGRYLSAGAGALLTSVRYVKVSRGETFAIADGGTNLHMAAVGVGGFAKRSFPIVNLSRDRSGSDGVVTLTGPLCTPSDTMARKADLGEVEEGDVIAVLCSGAYGPTASPTGFLSHGYPNEVLVDGDDLHLVRAADSVSDIISAYRLPGDLPLPGDKSEFTISTRLSASDAHYGGGIVDGAHILQLFGDAVTGLAALQDGDESLLQTWENVEFQRPARPGDFLTVRARITRRKRLRRYVEVEALRTVRAPDAATSTVIPVSPPERIATAKGLIVVPMPNRQSKPEEVSQ
ncbi:hotdog domain-containing protein [Thalassococcus sp. S3]|uniref:hotdog domain-containing protein n=1 Tax=Thalassococcus sp. S3 TaxID=2017482 RepID=UPI0010247D2B|nr:hotdog domain-containing protein [Thalassococcus sp. S3]QBF29893.1 diaminopimelate decarboxylase [Thalassococcus sp. S3]